MSCGMVSLGGCAVATCSDKLLEGLRHSGHLCTSLQAELVHCTAGRSKRGDMANINSGQYK